MIAIETKAKIRPVNKCFKDFLGTPNNFSFFLSPTDALEIGKVIQTLHDNKAQGPNSIPTNFLKLLSPTCSEVLSSIFNSCMSTGIYPTCLKSANVIQSSKRIHLWIQAIIALSLYFLMSIKSLKNSFTLD